ncbi:anti-sigma factor [Segniliparus rugosus]|uniref:Regulator of SigK n=1 Tax=Segniliparus rugosus (strain ATCC BAA-974 / DSM 45345 / CCUG 50838 / CIP 108380 / JCM 13579 / CDC 945) TaxID=679197 RepID=E5XV10_SEGRC|nr:anti-sigma factor [Segniliparus rugosus]EFV11846.1 hypothetical protein HMPREF9336_03332 [Segniliparus rugosus ATCC BAA-974]
MRDEFAPKDLADLVELYALDALPQDEHAAFESALAEAGREEQDWAVAQIAATREALNRLAEPFALQPPARARDALLAEVRPTAWPRRWAAIAAIAACLVLLAVFGVWRFGPFREQIADQSIPRDASMVMTAPDAHMTMGKIVGQEGMVAITYSRNMNKAVILLPPTTRIPDNKVYQVWLVRPDSSMTSAGMIAPGEAGRPMVVAALGQATGVMLSLEPSSGMPKPTGAMVSEVEL